jgi:hypothetical protein
MPTRRAERRTGLGAVMRVMTGSMFPHAPADTRRLGGVGPHARALLAVRHRRLVPPVDGCIASAAPSGQTDLPLAAILRPSGLDVELACLS